MLRFVAVLALAISGLSAQSFEFSTVKRYAPRSDGDSTAPDVIELYRPVAMGRVTFIHKSLKSILMTAYGVGKDQIAGPPWLGGEYYDVVAEIPKGVTADQVPAMLQNLLKERFRMTVHRETAPRKGFALLASKGGAELAAAQAGSKPGLERGPGILRFRDYTVAEFARLLTAFMGRPVADQTGIQGNYDITLKVYGADLKLAGAVGGSSLRYLSEALRSLGLRLEAGTVPAMNIVVDKADRIPEGD